MLLLGLSEYLLGLAPFNYLRDDSFETPVNKMDTRRGSVGGSSLLCFKEPELPEIPDVDKPIVRNVLYTIWAIQEGGASPSIGWQVQTMKDGYIVTVSYGKEFGLSLRDLQLISDVNPLRIDSVIIRNNTSNASIVQSSPEAKIGCILCVKVLDQQQPVRITESEVVRVRKRHRGFLSVFDSA